ncbi:MAG TPA: M50 family metallopeptidase [Enorma phocaeensis]|uniref:M50 family metallopeptidase n=1 Tax=Enorma phocaeensis TaxID=1871019 RepID=A0A921ITZ0_9ACTN|nr:site-2 protease family protein [Enorma phocaeensis]HJG37063.1 M50 family metallopeptidase [Enorma phocaeensis]
MLVSVLSTAFWGILLLSCLVFLHEGGHFLAARACGVRVTEYFLGLPCRWRLAYTSRRNGTTFGITPLLLGGYAMICGMDPGESPHAARVLGFVHRRGTASVEDICSELALSEDEAYEACAQLMGWGSLEPVYDPEQGEVPGGSTYPSTYAAPARDKNGNTLLDGRCFDRAQASVTGAPWVPPMDDAAFLEQERKHTYLGKGFFARAFMLVAGILVNLVSGLLLLMSIYSIVGIEVSLDVNSIGAVEAGSQADEIGLEAGDTIVSVDGVATESWMDVVNALDTASDGEPFDIVVERDGVETSVTAALDPDGLLGISIPTQVVRLGPIESAQVSFDYIAQTAASILQLFNPAQTMEMLDSSTSIVGISVMSAQAAAAGPTTFLTLAALISFSLGLMNLLPIPPLDGGKLLIEIVQAVIGRELPLKVQTALSYVGVALFLMLFVYVLRNDVIRFIL